CFEADQPQRTRWTQSETSWPYLGVLRVLCGDSAPLPRTESRTDGLESAWPLWRRRRRTERAAERRARTLMRRVRAVAPAAARRPHGSTGRRRTARRHVCHSSAVASIAAPPARLQPGGRSREARGTSR